MSQPNKTVVMGLNDWAKNFVRNAKSSDSGDVVLRIDGAGDYRLQRYALEGGKAFYEYEYDQTWDSMTCTQTVFLALRGEDGEIEWESKWSEAVIHENELPNMEVPLL